MDLYESINRIKSIMYESVKDYEIVTYGDINSPNGMKVCIKSMDGKHIGKTSIIDFENGLSLSPNLTSFIETHNDPDKAPSDGPNMININNLEKLLIKLKQIDLLIKK